MAHPKLIELEQIEQGAWEDLAQAAPASFASAVGLQTRRIGGALFFMATKIPLLQFNWLAGAGLGADDGACIGEAVTLFHAADQRKFAVQIPPGPSAGNMALLAQDAGLQPNTMAWAKFYRETRSAPVVETALDVRELGIDERNVFAETAVAGFGMPPSMSVWLSQIVGRPRWHAYAAFDRGAPASVGALYVDGNFAWLGIGATRPEMRRKGGQSALLSRRIADAAKFGAQHAATETGVPQEGQPAPSYKNILKSGFGIAYVRANWTLPS